MWWKILLKWLKTLLNSKIFLYAVIAGCIYLWMIDRKNLSANVDRLKQNQDALLANQSEQIDLTKREFQKYYHYEDSIAQKIGIKPNQVQNVIVNNYHYKDTSIVQFPMTHSGDTMKFIKPVGCWKVEGYVLKDSITFTKRKFDDVFHTFLYNKKRDIKVSFKKNINFDHSFLFIKWNNLTVDAKTYSECKNDTIQVEKNLKIDN